MSAVAQQACDHSTIGADPTKVEFFECCHAYKKGDRYLDSVSKILREVWPIKPDYSKVDPATLENARLRGVEVDRLFCQWITGELRGIPPTRQDARDLFMKLVPWWNLQRTKARAQVILHDGWIAGTCDILTETRFIWDVKCTWEIAIQAELQLGLYAVLYEAMYGEPPSGIGILHITERFERPRPVVLDLKQCMTDARAIRDVWMACKRRAR